MKMNAVILAVVISQVSVALASDTLTDSEITQTLTNYFREREAEGFGGAVVVIRKGKTLVSSGFGMANREEELPWTTDTVTSIGSITKPLTGMALARLAQEGKLSFHDPLTKWFDNVPQDKKRITIHDLATHSAGMRDSFGSDFSPRATREWLLEKAMGSELLWGADEFGQRYRYSNTGYSLLAMIVEKASGKRYEQYLWDTFFQPLGLQKTGYTMPEWSHDELAHGYRKNGSDWGVVALKHALPDGPNWNLRGNGGIHTTLNEFARLIQALESDELLKPEYRKLTEAPLVAEGEGSKTFYGYGWSNATTWRGTRYMGHNGGNGIFFMDCLRFPDDDVLILFATNTASQFDDEPLTRTILRTVFPRPVLSSSDDQ